MTEVNLHVLQSRHSLFAVWRWPAWVWVSLIVAALFANLVLTVPILFTFSRINQYETAIRLYDTVLFPVTWIASRSEWLKAFFDWQWDELSYCFGHPQRKFYFRQHVNGLNGRFGDERDMWMYEPAVKPVENSL